jgi:hypothetical protein
MRFNFAPTSIVVATFAACTGTSDPGMNSSAAETGPIEMRVRSNFDSALDEEPTVHATSIVIGITRIDAKVDDASSTTATTRKRDGDDVWITLPISAITIDLLAKPPSGFASIGIAATLPAGGAEQLRLLVNDTGNYVVTADGVRHTLIVPSGSTSGIKVVGDFDIAPCATGTMMLAFEGPRAIVVHPASAEDNEPVGTWVMRPVVRVDEVVTSGSCPSKEDDDRDEKKGMRSDGDGRADNDDARHADNDTHGKDKR